MDWLLVGEEACTGKKIKGRGSEETGRIGRWENRYGRVKSRQEEAARR